MSSWVLKGLSTGNKTTPYPAREDTAPGVSPGLPRGGDRPREEALALAARCPTGAIRVHDLPGETPDARVALAIDERRCVHCFRCVRGTPTPADWQPGYEWAGVPPEAEAPASLHPAFGRSAHMLVVDAGDCGACLNEVKQLNNPYYNMHRLGFFVTPTPRQADILLVVGPLTDQMRVPLQKAYDAMPTPKRVIAVGACALSGGVFGPSFTCGAGTGDLLPVDVAVPGSPPPPLAILHGLLVAVGRMQPAELVCSPTPAARSAATAGEREMRAR